MTLPVAKYPYPCVTEDAHGSPLVAGTRVPVRRIWAWYRKGIKVETLIARYPSLGPEKVFGALAFAHANEELIEADLDRERVAIENAKKDTMPFDLFWCSKCQRRHVSEYDVKTCTRVP